MNSINFLFTQFYISVLFFCSENTPVLCGRLDDLHKDVGGGLDEQADTRSLEIHLVPFLLKDNSFKQVHNSKELDCPGDKGKLGRDHDFKTTYKVLRTADSQSGAASFSFRTSVCMSSEILRKSITLSMISPTTIGGPEFI